MATVRSPTDTLRYPYEHLVRAELRRIQGTVMDGVPPTHAGSAAVPFPRS